MSSLHIFHKIYHRIAFKKLYRLKRSIKNFLIIAMIMAVFFILASLPVIGETLTVTVISPSLPECSDGLDNDSDGLIDYPNDPGCSSANDNDETNLPAPFCGDGNCDSGENCSNCPADCGVCPSGGGGGGGSPPYTPVTRVIFSGKAYPSSTVTLLKDAQTSATTIAGPDANFQIDLSGLSAGNYIFSVYTEDRKGRRSSLLTFPISVTRGATTRVSGIFIAPTIDVDKSVVKLGETISIFGQTIPDAEILININSEPEFFSKLIATGKGAYLYQFDTTPLSMGSHNAKSKAIALQGGISSYSSLVGFIVGAETVIKEKAKILKGNLNDDDRVNLIDFSIAAYWYKRPSPPANVDLNSDGKVDLIDFSIMAYYWTG